MLMDVLVLILSAWILAGAGIFLTAGEGAGANTMALLKAMAESPAGRVSHPALIGFAATVSVVVAIVVAPAIAAHNAWRVAMVRYHLRGASAAIRLTIEWQEAKDEFRSALLAYTQRSGGDRSGALIRAVRRYDRALRKLMHAAERVQRREAAEREAAEREAAERGAS